MKSFIFRFLSLAAILALLISPAAAQTGQEGLPLASQSETLTSEGIRLEQSETGLYIIQFQDMPLSTYAGGKRGLAPTSPQVTGATRLDVDAPASQAYLAYLQGEQDQALRQIEQRLSRRVEVRHRYLNVLNAVAVPLEHAEAERIASLPQVVRVFPDKLDEMTSDEGPIHIGSPAVWEGGSPGGLKTQGEGVIIGIIDSGINSQHPSFAATDKDGYTHTNPFGAGVYKGWCVANPSFCNAKLIGAYNFYTAGTTPEDVDGHGSHVASTAAGNRQQPNIAVGPNSFPLTLQGVAPRANIIAYKVCHPSCPQSATTAAINQSIADGVNVINYSISGSDSPWTNLVSLAFLDAASAGIFVAASAGNSGPNPGSVAGSQTSPWIASVGATTIRRVIGQYLSVVSPIPPPQLENLVVVPGANTSLAALTSYEIAYNAGDPLACSALPAGTFTGKMALLERGGCTFPIKVSNAQAAGAVAVLVINNSGGPAISMTGLTGTPPAFLIDLKAGQALLSYVQANPVVKVEIQKNTFLVQNPDWQDRVAAFSSRGPSQYEILKPDLAAPGVNTLAAVSASDGITERYGFLNGTSMASPHAAGAGALLKALYPTWTPAEIKSALSSSALSILNKDDGLTPANPFDAGTGLLSVSRAAAVGLVFNETKANYQAANPAIGGNPRNLNQPSLVDYNCMRTCTWTRTVKSVSNVPLNYTASFESSVEGFQATIVPDVFTILPGQEVVLTITAHVDGVSFGSPAFGQVILESGAAWTAGGEPVRQVHSATASPALAIPDNAYNGSKASMACSTIDLADLPPGALVKNAWVRMAASHTWIGDLVVKLFSPAGSVIGLMSRPGFAEPADDGTGCCGDSSDLSSSFPLVFRDDGEKSAELMGNTIIGSGVVCRDDGVCSYIPNKGSIVGLGSLAELSGEPGAGSWQLCLGDAEAPDPGTLSRWTLTIAAEPLPVSTQVLPVVVTPQPAPVTLTVSPEEISVVVPANKTGAATLLLENSGDVELIWTIEEHPQKLVTLEVEPNNPSSPPLNLVNLVLDDGSVEDSVGLTAGGQLLWLNRFTPAAEDYPLRLTMVEVFFQAGKGVSIGELVDVYVYQDSDSNPANGAALAGSATGLAVQKLNGFSSFPVNIPLDGPGDVLIAVVNRTAGVLGGQYPAALDRGVSQGRSWVGFGEVIANPPTLPLANFGTIDSFGFPGNWLVRGKALSGSCVTPADIPWLTLSTTSGTVAPRSSTEVQLSFDPSGLAQGDYHAELCLFTNDAAKSILTIPVHLSVDAPYLEADLSIELSAEPVPTRPGQTSTFTATIRNNGPDAATGISLSIGIEEGIEFAGSASCSLSGFTLTCPIGDLPSGETTAVSADLHFSQLGLYTIGFTVTSSSADPDVLNNETAYLVALTEFPVYLPLTIR
jgi:uncharacterized repeat protein (TIGR01451 family)